MLRVLGGIRPHPNASGFDHALIAVRPPRKLRSFSASFDSIRGRVETAWRWDEAGAIGRRYRRMDEVGTPYCITVDHQVRPGR